MHLSSNTQVIIYTGKGGVGKTTCAASTSIRLADSGVKTLIISTDPAHSLGDCLGISLDKIPKSVKKNLRALELDAVEEMQIRFEKIREVIVRQMKGKGVNEMLAEEMIAFPGSLELFSLLKIAEIKNSGKFEALVVDTAPTGNTMRFLHFPEFLAPVRRALKVDRTYSRMVRPLSKLVGKNQNLPSDDFYASVFNLLEEIETSRSDIFNEKTYFRFVLNPDKLSLYETQRAISMLNVSGYTVDAVILNKILPNTITDKFFNSWKRLQQDYIKEANSCFMPIKILQAPLIDREVIGFEMLRSFAGELYKDSSPLERLTEQDMLRVERKGSDFVLNIHVPYKNKEEINLYKEGMELIVNIGPYERKIQLPALLYNLQVKKAKYTGNQLDIVFS